MVKEDLNTKILKIKSFCLCLSVCLSFRILYAFGSSFKII